MANEHEGSRGALIETSLRPGARIEGGVDAVVIGASFDGLVAAALLGRAGLKTVLIGPEDRTAEQGRREFAAGYRCIDGEHLVSALDPAIIASLDLYRHGLAYAARRLDSVYYFADGAALMLDGDLYRTRESIAAMNAGEAAAYGRFVEHALDAARALRPLFEGGEPPGHSVAQDETISRFLTGSVEDILDVNFSDEHVKALLAAEASFRSASRPTDPYSFLSLLRRWSGEAAGLQAAHAYAEGGAAGVVRAVRRAAQAAKVEFRPAATVKSVLVEWDAAAGVELADGGQVRAPIVVCALGAAEMFLGLIGPGLIDLEFQSAVTAPASKIGSARVHFALTGSPGDQRTKSNLARRLVCAPDRMELRRAYNAARAGAARGPLIMEAVVPSVFEQGLAPETGHVVSSVVHPTPWREEPTRKLLDSIEEAARASLERLAPGVTERILSVDVQLIKAPASPPVMAAWARGRRLASASGVKGLYFCGPEIQIGSGHDGAPARRAAESAVRYLKRRPHKS